MLCARIEPLCRLVEQQYTRLEQQQLCNGAFLLFTAAQIIRMAVEQRLNSYARRDIRYLSVPLGTRDLELTEYLKKVGTNGVAKKYRLRILRQKCEISSIKRVAVIRLQGLSGDDHLAAIRLFKSRYNTEHCGLSGAVSAEQAVMNATGYRQRTAAKHIRQVAFVSLPYAPQLYCRAVVRGSVFHRAVFGIICRARYK